MRKTIFFVAFVALLVVCTGCKKNTVDKFVGTYNLVIDYDAYMDGTLDESGTFEGTLTITTIDENKVNVEGVVNLKGKEVTLYKTTGVLNENGNLQLAKSTFNNGVIGFDITYDVVVYRSPLTFFSAMTTEIEGYEVNYEMRNSASKR